jgi:signal transduction histidine kinase
MNAMIAPLAGPDTPELHPEDDWLHERMSRLEAQVRELEAANQALQHGNAATEALLAQCAADLRTPMSLILGYQQVMQANPTLRTLFERDAEARQLMDGLSGAVERMQGVISEIGLLARVLSGRMELTIGRVKLAEVLARAVSAFAEPMRQRRIALRVERVSFPNAIDADETLLDMVFRHLVSNAIKYTPDGGAITLAARVIPGATPGGVVRFSIRDSGVGIAPENLERIFGVYTSTPGRDATSASRTDFLGPGAGLGLVVCKGIVEAHGGRLWAESAGYEPERCPGSEFVVVLPVRGRDA